MTVTATHGTDEESKYTPGVIILPLEMPTTRSKAKYVWKGQITPRITNLPLKMPTTPTKAKYVWLAVEMLKNIAP